MPYEESNNLKTQVLFLSVVGLSSVHSFNDYFLSAYYVLGAALGTWNIRGNKTKIPALVDRMFYLVCVRWGQGTQTVNTTHYRLGMSKLHRCEKVIRSLGDKSGKENRVW